MKAKHPILFEAIVCLALLAGAVVSSWFVGGQAWAAPHLQAAAGDVVINEVLYDPVAVSGYTDTQLEWFELYNNTDDPITLSGWTIEDNTSGDPIPTVSISAHGFIVVAANSEAFNAAYPAFSGTMVAIEGTIGNGLRNDGDHLILRDEANTIIDAMSYGTDTAGLDPACPDVVEGHSLERSPAGYDTDQASDFIDQDSPTPSSGLGPVPTPAPTPTVPPTPTASVVINEVAWAGTDAGSADEWIELYNNTAEAINLTGWTLRADDGGPNITLSGDIPAYGYYLIERTDDNTVSDIEADMLTPFGNGLANGGERLTLANSSDVVIDTANGDGGGWPAGTDGSGTPPFATMERVDPTGPDVDSNWATNDGVTRNGLDADGAPINGTPKALNSATEPPTAITLASFTAKPGVGSATLAWETGTEVDNAGFNLHRATAPEGPYTRINVTLIAAEGDPVAGASYSFLDKGLPAGAYYYKLEDVDYYGVTTLHGPVSATVLPRLRRPAYRPMLP